MKLQELNSSFWLGPENASRACLLIHGFSGTSAEMQGLGKTLAAHGVRAHGIALAGHSGNPDDMLTSGRKHWIASAEEGLAQLSHYHHIFVAGLSMGGVLSLLLASRYQQRISGVIALSTPTRFGGGWQVHAVPLARYFMKWYYPLQHADFTNPLIQAQIFQQAHAYDPDVKLDFTDAQQTAQIKQMVRIPIPAIAELFALTNQVRRRLDKISSPLLIVHSTRDQIVSPQCARELNTLTRHATPKFFHWLERSGHVITMGPERNAVFDYTCQFIDAVTAPAANIVPAASAQKEVTDER